MNRKITAGILSIVMCVSFMISAQAADITDRIQDLYIAGTPEETEYEQHVSEVIFYGDSRVVGMGMTCSGNVYIGEVSMGYDWMAGSGLSQLLSAMESHPDADIVFCFGVNDVGNIGSYTSWFRSFAAQYPNRRMWFESVNPIDDGMASACGYFANDSMVINFNNQLQQALPEYYIDTYSYLVGNGFGTQDGIHYTDGTYWTIEQATVNLIEERI